MKLRTLAPLAAALLFSSGRLEAQPFFPLEPDDGIGALLQVLEVVSLKTANAK